MPTAQVIELIERVRRRLLAMDGVLAAGMIDAYGAIWVRISREVDALLEQIMGQQMTFAQVQQVQRYQALLLEARVRVERYVAMAEGNITATQRQMVTLSQSSVRGIVDAALPRGVDTQMLAKAGIQWVRLPAEAFEMFIGISGDGSPLANLLSPLGQEASIGIREGLREGIALGRGPRETASLIRQRFGMPLTRSLNIARTETLRAFRESSRLQYAANSNVVKGWERRSARDDRVCFPAGTLVETVSGSVPIETVRHGDLVWTGKGRLRRVRAVTRRVYTGELIAIETTAGGRLVATPEHPILLARQGKLDWYSISSSRVGDSLHRWNQATAQNVNHLVGDRPIEREIRDADDKWCRRRVA